MNNRFILQPYTGTKSRFRCPKCRHPHKTFKRYIDTETNQYLADHVGRCDREEQCGYHFSPRDYFAVAPYDVHIKPVKKYHRQPNKSQFNVLPRSLVKDSCRAYSNNNFISFLAKMFGEGKALELAALYHIGTASHWQGATVFWQIDIKGNVRTGKIMLYDRTTCKRVKQPFNHIAWVHRLMRNAECRMRNENKTSAIGTPTSEFILKQCLFGEHLLINSQGRIVCLVESEKTAIIASVYMPEYIWLAAGSLNGLNEAKCRVLANRTVIMFPDVNGYAKWHSKAQELNLRIPSATFVINDSLELSATDNEREQGIDLADRWIAEFEQRAVRL